MNVRHPWGVYKKQNISKIWYKNIKNIPYGKMYLRLFIFMWRYLGPCQRFIMEPLMLMAMNYFREKVLSWMFDRLVNIPLYSSSKVFSANFYLFKVNNRNTRKRCEICSKLTIKTPERRYWRRSAVFIVNFEHISHLFLVFLTLTWNKKILAGFFSC